MSKTLEAAVRAMTKAKRRQHLETLGWRCITNRASGCWQPPPGIPDGFYTLAAAIRTALTNEDGHE